MKKYCKIEEYTLEFEEIIEEEMQVHEDTIHTLCTFTNGDKDVEYIWDDCTLSNGNPYFKFKTEEELVLSDWHNKGEKPYTLISKDKFMEIKEKSIQYNKLKDELQKLFYD